LSGGLRSLASLAGAQFAPLWEVNAKFLRDLLIAVGSGLVGLVNNQNGATEIHVTLMLQSSWLDDSPVRRYSSRQRKRCLNFLYVLVARIKLDQPEIGDVRDRAIDYRSDCHGSNRGHGRTAVNRAATQYRNREIYNDTHFHSDTRRHER
jgi:hypothetical protein